MQLEELINQNHSQLSSTELAIAQYILENKDQITQLSIAELAEKSLSSKASVVRFSQKIGFNGFTELKSFIKWSENNRIDNLEMASKEQLVLSIEKTLDYLKDVDWKEIFQLIDNSEKMYVIYTGVSQRNQIIEMERLFLFVGKPVISIPADTHTDEFKHFFNVLKQNDLVFIISLSGENPNLNDVLNLLSLKRVKTISITNYFINTLSQNVDYNLYATSLKNVDTTEYFLQSNSSFYVIIEALAFGYLDYKKKMN